MISGFYSAYRISNNWMMETAYSKLKWEISYNCEKWCSDKTYHQKVNSSIVSKCAMKSFNETFPLARIFPLAIMHTPSHLAHFPIYKWGREEGQETMRIGSKFRNSCLEVLLKNSSSENRMLGSCFNKIAERRPVTLQK